MPKINLYTKEQTDTALADKQDTLTAGTGIKITDGTIAINADTAPTSGSAKPVTSGGVKTALDAKQDALTAGTGIKITSGTIAINADTTPTASSTNPVTSGGIKTALDAKVAKTGAQTMNGELTLTNNVSTYQEVTGINLKNAKKSKSDTVWLAAINVIDKNGKMCARLVWEANGTGKISLQSMVLNTDGTEKWTTLNQGNRGDTMTTMNMYSKEQTDGLLDAKQDKLTFDTKPTAGSTNPVTSGGIKTELTGMIKSIRFKLIGTSGALPAQTIAAGGYTVQDIDNAVKSKIPAGYVVLDEAAFFIQYVDNNIITFPYFQVADDKHYVRIANPSSTSQTCNNCWVSFLVIKADMKG